MKKDRNALITKTDSILSQIIIKKYKECFICGSKKNLTCGHLITRKIYITRWDFDNVRCQCKSCNLLHKYQPEIFTLKYIDQNGLEKYRNIVEKTKIKKKMTDKEIKKKYKELLEIKELLEKGGEC